MDFIFTAINYEGKKIKGYTTSTSKKELYKELLSNNLYPCSIKRDYKFKIKSKVTLKITIEFIQQWISLEKAKIKTQEALEIIKNTSSSKTLKQILEQIIYDLSYGNTLKETFKKYKSIFHEYFINHLIIGFEKDNLLKTLELLLEYYNTKLIINNKIKSSTLYPKLIITVFLIAFFIASKLIIPSFLDLYKEMGSEINPIIMTLMSIFRFISENIIYILLIIFILYKCFRVIFRNRTLKYFLDVVKIKLFTKYYKLYYTYLFSQGIDLMWSVGYNKYESLEMLNKLIPNLYYQRKFNTIKDNVERGMLISNAIVKENLFDNIFCKMIMISEQNNFKDDNLKRASDYYKYEYKMFLEKASKLIEPVLLGIISIFIIMLVIIILVPMMNGIGVVM